MVFLPVSQTSLSALDLFVILDPTFTKGVAELRTTVCTGTFSKECNVTSFVLLYLMEMFQTCQGSLVSQRELAGHC